MNADQNREVHRPTSVEQAHVSAMDDFTGLGTTHQLTFQTKDHTYCKPFHADTPVSIHVDEEADVERRNREVRGSCIDDTKFDKCVDDIEPLQEAYINYDVNTTVECTNLHSDVEPNLGSTVIDSRVQHLQGVSQCVSVEHVLRRNIYILPQCRKQHVVEHTVAATKPLSECKSDVFVTIRDLDINEVTDTGDVLSHKLSENNRNCENVMLGPRTMDQVTQTMCKKWKNIWNGMCRICGLLYSRKYIGIHVCDVPGVKSVTCNGSNFTAERKTQQTGDKILIGRTKRNINNKYVSRNRYSKGRYQVTQTWTKFEEVSEDDRTDAETSGNTTSMVFSKCEDNNILLNDNSCRSNVISPNDFQMHTGDDAGTSNGFTCHICGLTCSKQFLKAHMKRHMPQYRCYMCDGLFFTEWQRSRHMLKKHDFKKPVVNYFCQNCDTSFIKKSEYTKHIRKHPTCCPFRCDQCGAVFVVASSLAIHIRKVHFKETNSICSFCGKMYYDQTALKSHVRTVHTPQLCQFCGKVLSRCNMKHHESLHTAGKWQAFKKRKSISARRMKTRGLNKQEAEELNTL